MKLSIIIPLYNCEKEISQCLTSIYDNIRYSTYHTEIEVIIVDDGSTDDSVKIVDNFISDKNTTNFYLYKKNNGGVSSARNVGLEYAIGDYMWFIDSDDFILPNCIESVLNIICNSDADLLIFDSISGYRGDINIPMQIKQPLLNNYSGAEYIAKFNYRPYSWQYLIKKKSIPKGLKFEENRYFEDTIFTTELLLSVNKVISSDLIVYCYITRDNSITHNIDFDHQNKVIDDYIFVAKYLTNILKTTKINDNRTQYRIKDRRNSFLFFLLIKVFRFHPERFNEVINTLKKDNLYPFKTLDKQSYPGIKFSFLGCIMNQYLIWSFACSLNKLRLKIIR